MQGQTPLNEKSNFIQWADNNKDKMLYFGARAVTSMIVYDLVKDKKKAFWYALASSVTIGVAKESYDQITYGGWDWKDLGATVLGGVTATFIIKF